MGRYVEVGSVLLCLVLAGLLLFYCLPPASRLKAQPQDTADNAPRLQLHPPKRDQVVLVTGAAGFIGYHVSLALVREWGARVVGLDLFTDYYDVQLKKDRGSELVKVGVELCRGDVCDRVFLEYLFAKFNFTFVVHLAAQAGVRHSMQDPVSYVRNNVQCFLTLLQVLRGQKHTRLLYASSSTVYGHHSPLPFSPSSTILVPSSTYAATKMSNEHFARVFCSEHGLKAVGVRFFTAYGPWGRPDMAVYSFAERMYGGREVMFHNATHPILRDFTFISDTVGGVLLAMEHMSVTCGEVYNIGSGQAVRLRRVLELLQEELGAAAKITYLPLPPFDLSATRADISKTRRVLGYEPRVEVREGVKEFVKWFRDYQQIRSDERETARRNVLLEAVLEEREREKERSWREEVKKENAQYRERIKTLQDRYKTFAREVNRDLPGDLSNKEFVYHQGVDSPGGNIMKAQGYQGHEELMKERCRGSEQCLAFNSKGEFKNHVLPHSHWTRTSDTEGLYVADLNLCLTDLHSCAAHQDCIHTGPSGHNCTCHKGYAKLGAACVAKYVEGELTETETKVQLTDYFDGVNWEKMTKGKKFIFFQGLDSPGGDYLLVGTQDVQTLERACRNTQHCLAFNSNGILKQSLHPPHLWVHWTDDPQGGLYVLDVNYCHLAQQQCPTHSSCHGYSPGNYSCKCVSPQVLTTEGRCEMEGVASVQADRVVTDLIKEEEGGELLLQDSRPRRDAIHVIISVDAEHFPGALTLLTSLHTNMAPDSLPLLRVHVVLAGSTSKQFRQYLQCHASFPRHLRLDVVELDQKLLEGRVRVYSSEEEVGKLKSSGNFARFFFHTMFPDVSRALYLDADTVVKGDLAELWRELEHSYQLLLAVPRNTPTYGDFFSSQVEQLFEGRYGKVFGKKERTFNAGVYGVNFDMWRRRDIHKDVLYWLDQQSQQPLWRYGTQPVMLLVGHGQWDAMDALWNVNGLGWNKRIPEEELESAKLLHWSGKAKPWLEDGLYKDLWLDHAPKPCSGRGVCMPHGPGYACECRHGYSGEQCQVIQ